MIPEDYDRYKLSGRERRDYLLVSMSLLAVCGYLYFANWTVAAVLAATSFLGIPAYKKTLAEKRKLILRNQFKDMLYSISSSISSGRHFGEALADSERAVVMIYGEDCLLAREIRNMKRIMRETNCSEETVLRDLAERSHVREIIDFNDSCAVCRTTGGNLNSMVMKAVNVLTQSIELEKEKEVLLSEKRLESRILSFMPVIVIALINLMSADYLEAMYSTTGGRMVMALSFALTAGSAIWCMRLMEK